jgi:hypothetical protein
LSWVCLLATTGVQYFRAFDGLDFDSISEAIPFYEAAFITAQLLAWPLIVFITHHHGTRALVSASRSRALGVAIAWIVFTAIHGFVSVFCILTAVPAAVGWLFVASRRSISAQDVTQAPKAPQSSPEPAATETKWPMQLSWAVLSVSVLASVFEYLNPLVPMGVAFLIRLAPTMMAGTTLICSLLAIGISAGGGRALSTRSAVSAWAVCATWWVFLTYSTWGAIQFHVEFHYYLGFLQPLVLLPAALGWTYWAVRGRHKSAVAS